jgi:adenosylcobinamide-phosphate guanylyltransferase
MAGGKGTRLAMGEKPLAQLRGKALIEHVCSALRSASRQGRGSPAKDYIDRIFVAVTSNVPATRSWAIGHDLEVIDTKGLGYVADMVEAVELAGISDPVMIIMADLPLITHGIIEEIINEYERHDEQALSTHTPLSLHALLGRRPDSLFNYNGQLIVPCGVNILDGADIRNEQPDHHLIMNRIELAVNVNTASDLELCEKILRGEIQRVI